MKETIEWFRPEDKLPYDWIIVLVKTDHTTSIGWHRVMENEGKWFVWDNNESRDLNGFNDEIKVIAWAEMPKGVKI